MANQEPKTKTMYQPPSSRLSETARSPESGRRRAAAPTRTAKQAPRAVPPAKPSAAAKPPKQPKPAAQRAAFHTLPSAQPAPRWAAPLGAGVLTFALIGVILLVVNITAWTTRPDSHPELFEQYETLLAPVVMFDPAPFEQIASLEDKQPLLLAGIWAALDATRDEQQVDAVGDVLLPGDRVTEQLIRLFGEEGAAALPLVGVTVNDQHFEYDILDRCYHIPLTSHLGDYAPRVQALTVRGDRVTVTVGYLLDNEYEQGTAIVKRQEYHFKGYNRNKPVLVAIRSAG